MLHMSELWGGGSQKHSFNCFCLNGLTVTCVLSAAMGHDSCGVLRSVDNKQSAEISV